jgi:hypothetical protein
MSQVHKRFRKETELQFLVTSQELQFAITKLVMSEKNMPKKYRYMVGQSLIAKVDEMLDNLNGANTIFPTTKEEYLTRERYQQKAIINCRQIHNKLVRIIFCVEGFKVEKLETIAELLTNSEILIKKWKKTDKERYKKLFTEK